MKTPDADGRNQFGSANAATSGAGGNIRFASNAHLDETINEDTSVLEALNGYFDNLAAATTNEKALLEQLVTNNKKLTVTNEEPVIVIKKLTRKNEQLQQEIDSLCNRASGDGNCGAASGQRNQPKKSPITNSRCSTRPRIALSWRRIRISAPPGRVSCL